MVRLLIYFIFTAIGADGSQLANEAGKLFIDGNKYRLEVEDELLVVCDGNTQWIYKPQTDDILIATSQIADNFSESGDFNETVQNLIALFAPNGSASGNTVVKKGPDGRVKEVTINLGGKSYYKIELTSVKESDAFPDSHFSFDTADYPSAIVTDMR